MTLDDPKTVVARGALAATMMGFTEGSGQVTATKSQQPNNPFGVGPRNGGRGPGSLAVAGSAAARRSPGDAWHWSASWAAARVEPPRNVVSP